MSNMKMTENMYKKLESNASVILKNYTGEKREIRAVQNNNWVFITDDQKEPYMVKFVPEKEAERLEIEKRMYEFIKSNTNIPVPDLLKSGKINYGRYILREVVPGESLKSYLKRRKNVKNILYQAGQILAEMHCIEFENKGLFTPDFSVKKYEIFSKSEYNSFLNKLYKGKLISKREYSLLDRVDVDYYFDYQNVLCHSDYSPNNILVKEGSIVSIIDMEWACSAPFMDDLASFDLFLELESLSDAIDSYYEGYNSVRQVDKFFFENLDFYKFYRLLTMLSYQVAAEDERFDGKFQNSMKKKFRKILSNSPNFKEL